jgi:hypothetical protein
MVQIFPNLLDEGSDKDEKFQTIAMIPLFNSPIEF